MKATRRIISYCVSVLSLLLLLGVTSTSVQAESEGRSIESETTEIPQNWLKDIQIFYEKPLGENNGSELPPPPDPPENIEINEEASEEEISSQDETSSVESSDEVKESEISKESSVSNQELGNEDETKSSDNQQSNYSDESENENIKQRPSVSAVSSRVLSEASLNSHHTSRNSSKHLLRRVFNTIAAQKEILPLLADTMIHKNFISVFCNNHFDVLSKLYSSVIKSIF